MKARCLIACVAVLLRLGVEGATSNNGFATIRSAGEVATADDGTFVLHHPGNGESYTISPRAGWRLASGEDSVSRTHTIGGRETINLRGMDGEERASITVTDDWIHQHEMQDEEKHLEAPVLSVTNAVHALVAYPATEPGASSLGEEESVKFVTNGHHVVVSTPQPCPVPDCTWKGSVVSNVIEITEDFGTLKTAYVVTPEAINGCYPYGTYRKSVMGQWTYDDCCEKACDVTVSTEGQVDVYAVAIDAPIWVGLDRTDEGKATPLRCEARLMLTPEFAGVVYPTWSTGTLLEPISSVNETLFVYGGTDLPRGSESKDDQNLTCDVILTDEHEDCYAQTTCEMNYTVVGLDVEIERLDLSSEENEELEESEGADVALVRDQPDGTWSALATNLLSKVRFTCEPENLPDDESLTISVMSSCAKLFEKRDDAYVEAKELYTVKELRTAEFYLHGYELSETYRDGAIEIVHEKSGARDRALFTVLGRPLLVPDYDRNGTIDEADMAKATDGQTTFRFWINDDDNAEGLFGTSNDKESSGNDVPGEGKNYADGDVNGRMDLIDFTPILLDVTEAFPSSASDEERNACKWKLQSSCLNVVWTGMEADKVRRYFDPTIELRNCGKDLDEPAYCADVIRLEKESAVVPDELLRPKDGRRYVVFLVEGSAEWNEKEPALVVTAKTPEHSWRGELRMNISSVMHMFDHYNLREVPTNGTENCQVGGNQSEDEINGCPYEGRHVIYVHGYNVNETRDKAWAAGIFKRLWQTGVNAKYSAVDWFGNDSQFFQDNCPDYYINVSHAAETAAKLASIFNSKFPNDRKYIIGHSLGNMLVSMAATLDLPNCPPLKYTKYFMLNAAVPSEAYSTSAEEIEQMIDEEWREVDRRLWACNFYRNPCLAANDFRRTLTWRGRFAGIKNAINFYTPSDEVLLSADLPKSFLDRFNVSVGCWVNQELFKGTGIWKAINVLTWSSVRIEGGWGFNDYYRSHNEYMAWFGSKKKDDNGRAIVNRITDAEALIHPLFRPFEPAKKYDMHSAKTVVIADQEDAHLIRSRYLADGVPSLCRAAGAHRINGWANGTCRNLEDLELGKWPRSEGAWLHSDLKNVAYLYTQQLYHEMKKEIQ